MGAPEGSHNYIKGRRWKDAIERALAKRSKAAGIEALDALAEKLLAKCDEMDVQALKELGDRLEGKPTQPMSGPEGGALKVEVVTGIPG